jgi:hypothetical protein
MKKYLCLAMFVLITGCSSVEVTTIKAGMKSVNDPLYKDYLNIVDEKFKRGEFNHNDVQIREDSVAQAQKLYN